MFVVYAIECSSSNRVYIGQTQNFENRLALHNNGDVKSTSNNGPWCLIALESFDLRNEARWCETLLKKSRGRRNKWLLKHKI